MERVAWGRPGTRARTLDAFTTEETFTGSCLLCPDILFYFQSTSKLSPQCHIRGTPGGLGLDADVTFLVRSCSNAALGKCVSLPHTRIAIASHSSIARAMSSLSSVRYNRAQWSRSRSRSGILCSGQRQHRPEKPRATLTGSDSMGRRDVMTSMLMVAPMATFLHLVASSPAAASNAFGDALKGVLLKSQVSSDCGDPQGTVRIGLIVFHSSNLPGCLSPRL